MQGQHDNLTIKGSDIEAFARSLGVTLSDAPDITVGDLKDGTLAVESDASAKVRRKQAKDAQRAIKVGSPAPVVEAVPLQVQPIMDDVPSTVRDRWKKMLGELAQANALQSPISKAEAEYVSGGDLQLMTFYRRVRSDTHYRMVQFCGDSSECHLEEGQRRSSWAVDFLLDDSHVTRDSIFQKYEEFEPTRWTRFKRWAGLEKPPIPFGSLKGGGVALLLVIAALASQADGEGGKVVVASSGAALALQAAGRGMKDRDDALKVAGTSSSSGAGGSSGGDRRAQVLVQLKEATQKCQSFGTLDLVNNPLTNLPGWAIEKVLGQDHEASKTYWCQRKAQLEQELTNLDALALDQARGEAQARGLNVPPPAQPSGGGGFGGGGGRAAGPGGAGAPVGGAGASGLADPGLLNQAPPPPSLLERAACFFGMCLTPPAPSGGFVQDTSRAINDTVDNFFGGLFRVALIAAAVLVVLGGVLIYTSGSTAQAVIPAVVPHLSGIVTAGGGAASQYLGSVGQLVQPIGQLVTSVTPSGQLAQVGDAVGLLKTVGGLR